MRLCRHFKLLSTRCVPIPRTHVFGGKKRTNAEKIISHVFRSFLYHTVPTNVHKNLEVCSYRYLNVGEESSHDHF